ncbi:hypothetical protein [Rhizobium ruizarguesonis]|uniref:hypothetical protein n=1 Tax=Rhizobium ruizarguesonis TaxID=2081791 RepID=UPI0010316769|nr:hypothetical protein [Rhizobium ruizarguesonis]TAV14737.1 hypothetical protein ELI34_04315 [Rhizobium ruizarguesonis]
MANGEVVGRFGDIDVVHFKPSGQDYWVRLSHILADNEQMRARAQRVQAHIDTEDRTLSWAQDAIDQLTEKFADEGREDEQARLHVEGANAVENVLGHLRDMQQYRQAEIDRDIMMTRLEKAGIADMLVSDVINGNISNPITTEIERTVDELVRLCRVAGQLEADLTVPGKKRHAKTELKRIDKIVDQEKQHLLDGIAAIRKSNRNTRGYLEPGQPSRSVASAACCAAT